jgi:hypothetical protein
MRVVCTAHGARLLWLQRGGLRVPRHKDIGVHHYTRISVRKSALDGNPNRHTVSPVEYEGLFFRKVACSKCDVPESIQ